jgi:hypothetical protein
MENTSQLSVFIVEYADGKSATVVSMTKKTLEEAEQSMRDRFTASRIKSVRTK